MKRLGVVLVMLVDTGCGMYPEWVCACHDGFVVAQDGCDPVGSPCCRELNKHNPRSFCQNPTCRCHGAMFTEAINGCGSYGAPCCRVPHQMNPRPFCNALENVAYDDACACRGSEYQKSFDCPRAMTECCRRVFDNMTTLTCSPSSIRDTREIPACDSTESVMSILGLVGGVMALMALSCGCAVLTMQWYNARSSPMVLKKPIVELGADMISGTTSSTM